MPIPAPQWGKIINMSIQDSINKGVFFGFIPHRLQIPDRPELNNYPFNVMFSQYGTKNGKNVMGSAIYIPDLKSFTQLGEKSSMKYINSYGGISWLLIEYDLSTKNYNGYKTVNDISVGEASGPQWNMFFVHFTALGLTNGERCNFKEL